MSRWGPALRIGRRTVRRSLGRSLLVAVLVGLPVAGATFVDILARTFSDPAREAARAIGSADASVTVTRHARLVDYRPSRWNEGVPAEGPQRTRPVRSVDLAEELPAGSVVMPDAWSGGVELTVNDRLVRSYAVVTDLGVPLAGHIAVVESGTAPGAPDELLVSRTLAERLELLDGGGDLRDGARVTVRDGPTLVVSGLSSSPYCLNCEQLVARPGSTLARSLDTAGPVESENRYLVDLPAGVDVEALWRRLAERGIAMTPRDAYLHPERYEDFGGGIDLVSPEALRAAALAALVTGLGLLEVVLLAGTAFAVGARRQVRELGVLSAAGATARQIRRIVLAQGLVLGLMGAVLGIAFGTAVALAGRPVWERLDNAVISGWNFGPWEIVGAALIGVVSGVLAAVVPAVGAARMTPVDALSGRFRVSRASRRRTPLIGAGLVVAGVTLGVIGERMMASAFAAYIRSLRNVEEGTWGVSPPSPSVPVSLVLLGAVLAVTGLVVLAPALITQLSKVGRSLPLSGRLAVRDAARHRHRTGPATSAIAVAVAGSVVFAFVLAGDAAANEAQYVESLPPHVMSVDGDMSSDEHSGQRAAEAAAAAAAELPDARLIRSQYIWPAAGRDEQSPALTAVGPVAVAERPLIELALGRPLSAAEMRHLRSGKALVLRESAVNRSGNARLEVGYRQNGRPLVSRVPAIVAQPDRVYPGLPVVFVPHEVVEARGWRTAASQTFVAYGSDASQEEVEAALAAAEANGSYGFIESGPPDPSRVLLVIAGLAAAFVTLVGVAISVALSAAEGRADLATLAAVGAPPRRRRSLAAAQALLVGGLGCLLGLALGSFVAYTLRATVGAPQFVVPWSNLLAVGVVVPLLAVVVAAVFTPSRLPLVARREW